MVHKVSRTSTTRCLAVEINLSRHNLPMLSRSIAMSLLSAIMTVGARVAWAEPITSPAFPGKCVEGSIQGGLLSLMDCNSSAAQDFRFDPGTSRLVMHRSAPQLCFDLNGPVRTGMGVSVSVCNDNAAQKWAFPFDSRLRPVGVDPNKCLTHATRVGKPPTGWGLDVAVVDPGCEFPEVGGGGFCLPTFEFFFEMMLSKCEGLNVQQWSLRQEGMPFPSEGIVTRKVHVTVNNMKIDDCREGGACDWKLHCGIGNEADTELVGMVEKDTGGTIDVNRTLIHESGLPVTVTCQVREFDRGIFDPDVWEVVGTVTRTFGAAGPGTMQMDNSEGKVTINFTIEPLGVIQQPLSAEQLQAVPIKIDAMHALRLAGVDFSVPEADLRDWLSNPSFTPYPAITGALIKMLGGKQLRRPVFIDVIVFNYEHAPGASSPRRMADVDLDLLAKAIVKGHNTRYGEAVRDLQNLLQ
ncbi:RICIN domain-containing protein [Methylocaldum sp. RMAD-M]|jgi:hypothetical protein|uniref:RICIN domain-containing protein n=4 Tax=unclassified Methylocaldum TaxID=2622260 RepID=UPI001AE71D16|nr:RICIN domain-containing protein [Methylocaldum sp. RMAD-M]